MGNRRHLFSSLAIGAAALLGTACGGGGGGGGGSTAALSDYVAAVTSSDGTIQAVKKTGAPPVATSPGTASSRLAAAAANLTFLRGGTAAIPVDPAATRVIVAITGVDGYWELTGLTPGTGLTVLVTFGQTSPETFTLHLGAGSATSLTYEDVAVALTTVGTGDVQVNVTWDLDVDVDLHVLDPSGAEIYYGNTASASGGVLDLDSNPACSLDHVKAENITWPTGKAPSGTYKVLVDYFEACTTGPVNYVVTVNVKGHAPQTFAKTFADGASDFGSTCFPSSGDTLLCGVQITTFTVP